MPKTRVGWLDSDRILAFAITEQGRLLCGRALAGAQSGHALLRDARRGFGMPAMSCRIELLDAEERLRALIGSDRSEQLTRQARHSGRTSVDWQREHLAPIPPVLRGLAA
jgi:hypothetical protein